MPIELHCKCGFSFSVPESTRGGLAECPACTGTIFVPSAPEAGEALGMVEPGGGSEAVGEVLTSDEMLALREEDRPAEISAAETQLSEEDAPPAEGDAAQGDEPVPGGDTEVALLSDHVVAGPDDSALEDDAAAGAGFAVSDDDEVYAERRLFERCPQCDVELEPEARICTNCGYNVITGDRVRRVTVEEPDQGAAEAAADVGLGVLAFVAQWIVKLRHVLIGLSVAAFLTSIIVDWVATNKRRTAYRMELFGGGLVGGWYMAAQEAVEKEAFDLERRKQEQIEIAMIKLNNEPQAEKGVFSPESKATAHDAYLRAREAYVTDRDPARAERILLAVGVLYGPMEPWGRRAREELARIRGLTGTSRPTVPIPATQPRPPTRPTSAPAAQP